MFPYSVLYWFGLSIGLCLIWPVSVWLSNSPGNYSKFMLLQVYVILKFSFLKGFALCLFICGSWSGWHPNTLVVPSQVLFYMFSFRYRYWYLILLQIPRLNYSWRLIHIVTHLVYHSHCDLPSSEIYTSALQTLLSKVTRLLNIPASKHSLLSLKNL